MKKLVIAIYLIMTIASIVLIADPIKFHPVFNRTVAWKDTDLTIDTTVFTGDSTDDCTSGGYYTGTGTHTITVEISDTGDGASDTIHYKWDNADWADTVVIHENAAGSDTINLDSGILLIFADSVAHQKGDYWTFTVRAADVDTLIDSFTTISSDAFLWANRVETVDSTDTDTIIMKLFLKWDGIDTASMLDSVVFLPTTGDSTFVSHYAFDTTELIKPNVMLQYLLKGAQQDTATYNIRSSIIEEL